MIKLIASDLDDTLLNKKLIISDRNKEAIQAARANDIIFTIATGRMFASAKPFAQELSLPEELPLICYNGALIKRLSGETLYKAPIEHKLAVKIVDFCVAHGWTTNVYFEDRLYVAEMNSEVEAYQQLAQVPVNTTGNLVAFVQENKVEPEKILVTGPPEEVAKWLVVLQSKFDDVAQVLQSKQKYIEITCEDAHKGKALGWLANYLGISMSEVLAIGDSNNDVSMLKQAGIGVVVENGLENARKAADYVVASHDDHGVAQAINSYALCGK